MPKSKNLKKQGAVYLLVSLLAVIDVTFIYNWLTSFVELHVHPAIQQSGIGAVVPVLNQLFTQVINAVLFRVSTVSDTYMTLFIYVNAVIFVLAVWKKDEVMAALEGR